MADPCRCGNTQELLLKWDVLSQVISPGDEGYPAGSVGPQIVCKGAKLPVSSHPSASQPAPNRDPNPSPAGSSSFKDLNAKPSSIEMKFADIESSSAPSFAAADPTFIIDGRKVPASTAFTVFKDLNLYGSLTPDHIVQICLAFGEPDETQIRSLERKYPQTFNVWEDSFPETAQDLIQFLHKSNPYLIYKAFGAAAEAIRKLTAIKATFASLDHVIESLAVFKSRIPDVDGVALRLANAIPSQSPGGAAADADTNPVQAAGSAAGAAAGAAAAAAGSHAAGAGSSSDADSSLSDQLAQISNMSATDLSNEIVKIQQFIKDAAAFTHSAGRLKELPHTTIFNDVIDSVLKLLSIPVTLYGTQNLHPTFKEYRSARGAKQQVPKMMRDPRAPTAPPQVVGSGDWILPFLHETAEASAKLWKQRVLADGRDTAQVLTTPVRFSTQPGTFTDWESLKLQHGFWLAMSYRSASWSAFSQAHTNHIYAMLDDTYATKIADGDNMSMWNALMRFHAQTRAASANNTGTVVPHTPAASGAGTADTQANTAFEPSAAVCTKCSKPYISRNPAWRSCPSCHLSSIRARPTGK